MASNPIVPNDSEFKKKVKTQNSLQDLARCLSKVEYLNTSRNSQGKIPSSAVISFIMQLNAKISQYPHNATMQEVEYLCSQLPGHAGVREQAIKISKQILKEKKQLEAADHQQSSKIQQQIRSMSSLNELTAYLSQFEKIPTSQGLVDASVFVFNIKQLGALYTPPIDNAQKTDIKGYIRVNITSVNGLEDQVNELFDQGVEHDAKLAQKLGKASSLDQVKQIIEDHDFSRGMIGFPQQETRKNQIRTMLANLMDQKMANQDDYARFAQALPIDNLLGTRNVIAALASNSQTPRQRINLETSAAFHATRQLSEQIQAIVSDPSLDMSSKLASLKDLHDRNRDVTVARINQNGRTEVRTFHQTGFHQMVGLMQAGRTTLDYKGKTFAADQLVSRGFGLSQSCASLFHQFKHDKARARPLPKKPNRSSPVTWKKSSQSRSVGFSDTVEFSDGAAPQPTKRHDGKRPK